MIDSAALLWCPPVDLRRAMSFLVESRILQEATEQRRHELISYLLARLQAEQELPAAWSEWFAFAQHFPTAPASNYRELLEDDARRG
jgi:hypothetical protein